MLATPASDGTHFVEQDLRPTSGDSITQKSGYSFELLQDDATGITKSFRPTCNGFPAGTAVSSYKAIAYPISTVSGRRFFMTDTKGTIWHGTSKSGPWEPLQ
jgi:hypothetical protein